MHTVPRTQRNVGAGPALARCPLMPISWFRGGAALVWVAGIAGMIVSSVNGNNNGWVATCGVTTALATICLLSATAATRRDRIEVFDDADAERLEDRVQALVDTGTDEAAVRDLVRDALRLARRRGPTRG